MNSRSVHRVYVCLLAFCIFVPCRVASADAITLEWGASSGPTEGYRLYVWTQSGAYTQAIDVGQATTFTFMDAIAGQQYCFAVTAYSSSLESPQSNEVCGFSNAPPQLTNPGNQFSTLGVPTRLQLAATDPEGQAITYSQTGLPPGLTLQASTGFISGSGTTAGSYGVQITASDGVLTSSQSFIWGMGSSTTSPTTPSTPDTVVTLSVEPFDRRMTDQVRLSWTDASWTQVWIYRDGTQIGQVTNNVFTDIIRIASGTYTYTVCAPNATACSNSVTVSF